MKTKTCFVYLAMLLVCLSMIAVSCSTNKELPQSARDSLEKQWTSLPIGASEEFQIVSAKPGKKPVMSVMEDFSERETWCVEVALPADLKGNEGPDTMTWVVTRTDQEAEWIASPLMVMSALWPYEACGKMPGE